MRRIGIYGGSFNPIHNGHTQLGLALCEMGAVDELWYVVSPMNPFKKSATDLLSDEARLRLCELAVTGLSGLRVSDVEISMPRPSYMVDTLDKLKNLHPDVEFILVIGADNWLNFNKWYKWEEIMIHHPIIIYPRPGYPINENTLPKSVSLVQTPLIDISSTAIRRQIAAGTFDGRGVSPAVWNEIKAKKYYL